MKKYLQIIQGLSDNGIISPEKKILQVKKKIRKIIESYKDTAKIHLGGIPMIADDMMTYIKGDIIVFGAGVFLFIVFTPFRQNHFTA